MVPDIDILKIEMSRGHYFGVPGTNLFYRKSMSFVVLKKQTYFPSFMLESLDKVLENGVSLKTIEIILNFIKSKV